MIRIQKRGNNLLSSFKKIHIDNIEELNGLSNRDRKIINNRLEKLSILLKNGQIIFTDEHYWAFMDLKKRFHQDNLSNQELEALNGVIDFMRIKRTTKFRFFVLPPISPIEILVILFVFAFILYIL